MIVVLFFANIIYASNELTPTEAPRFEKCLQWKQVCYKKNYCSHPEKSRTDCYRCIKPGRYGFHPHPRQVDRTTCNRDTVDYLENMGYTCYQNFESSACMQSREKEFCDSVCVKYTDPR